MQDVKKWIYLFLILVSAGTVYFFHSSKPFKVESIVYPLAYSPEWDFPLSSKEESELKGILSQRFKFIGKGGQIYAFESEDGKHVIKFMKFKYLRTRPCDQLLSMLPHRADWKINEEQRRIRKTYRLFRGYKMAYEMNRKNSGLVYLHFNPTFHHFGPLEFYDWEGKKHSVDLDQVFFIVQKKGELMGDLLKGFLDQGKIDQALTMVNRFIEMYLEQYQIGLYDKDYGVMHNIGFIGEQPIHIDMGRLTYDEKLKSLEGQKADMAVVLSRFEEWLRKNCPEHAHMIMQNINKKLYFLIN